MIRVRVWTQGLQAGVQGWTLDPEPTDISDTPESQSPKC